MNEFKILNNIGRGSFSKVKKVLRIAKEDGAQPDPEGEGGNENMFAMKMMHKPVLIKQRAVTYSE